MNLSYTDSRHHTALPHKGELGGGLLFLLVSMLLAACSSPTVPTSYSESKQALHIYPDYADVTVPVNIAPLTFHIDDDASDYVTLFEAADASWTVGGRDVCPTAKQWRAMTSKALQAADGRLSVSVFMQASDGWKRFKPFTITVMPDSIDPYISYRLISPSYVTYEDLSLNQRCLETYDESLIYGNMINSDEHNGQCINCHHTQWYNPNRLQFHVRQHLGGTVIAYDGKVQKINLKTDSTLSAGVYPTWHPTKPWIVYSTNMTGQSFHTRDPQKIEVQDTKSNLIFYNLETNEVTPITRDTTDLDCFPFWSPDGKYIYYVSAHWERRDTVNLDFELIKNYKDVQYNLYRKAFDERTLTFGPRELVYNAVARNRSVTLPRISPDGRWLMFTQGQFGVFHIWHSDADLYLADLTRIEPDIDAPSPLPGRNETKLTHEDSLRVQAAEAIPLPAFIRPITEANSPDVDSYHSWSRNGRWVVFSSRRVDGNFTRPFITYFKADGTFTKPFELPQADPQYHRTFLRSYNIPEFMAGPVSIRPQEFARVIQGDATPAKLKMR